MSRQNALAPGDPGKTEPRAFHRVPADLPATLLSTALGRVRVDVLDISQSGCRVRCRARCHVGDRFVLRVGPMGPRQVTVMWREGEEMGLSFADLISWTGLSQIVFGGPTL